MLADGFASAMVAAPGPGEADAALFDLGWGELLTAAPGQGAAMAFTALGATGSSAAIIDDVLALALGLDVTPTTCVVAPPPPSHHAAGHPRRRRHPCRRSRLGTHRHRRHRGPCDRRPRRFRCRARDGRRGPRPDRPGHRPGRRARPRLPLPPSRDGPARRRVRFVRGRGRTNRSSFGVGAGRTAVRSGSGPERTERGTARSRRGGWRSPIS